MKVRQHFQEFSLIILIAVEMIALMFSTSSATSLASSTSKQSAASTASNMDLKTVIPEPLSLTPLATTATIVAAADDLFWDTYPRC
jgi:hypothetical protein